MIIHDFDIKSAITFPPKTNAPLIVHANAKLPFDDEAILARHVEEVDKDLGDPEGVLIVDGSDFPKQGTESVGVKRQWRGQLGKVANCQAGIFLGYASQHGYTLLDRRLYLPRAWLEDEAYAERRADAGVPAALTFHTKLELASALVKKAATSGRLRYRWLTCDELFGRDSAFLDGVAPYAWYLAEVPTNTKVWLQRPRTEVPAWSGHGRKPRRVRLVKGEPESRSVTLVAAQSPQEAWQQ